MRIVGIGGSTRAGSSTEALIRAVLDAASGGAVHTEFYTGPVLAAFPAYDPFVPPVPAAKEFVESVRRADAVVIGSPGYHGSVTGLVKNALDHLEELREDPAPYLDGRPVGLVATAQGWQAAVNTLNALRDVTHALRGWPTPLGLAVNMSEQGAQDFTRSPLSDRIGEVARQLVHVHRPGIAEPNQL